jgi:hypothetical protein
MLVDVIMKDKQVRDLQAWSSVVLQAREDIPLRVRQ